MKHWSNMLHIRMIIPKGTSLTSFHTVRVNYVKCGNGNSNSVKVVGVGKIFFLTFTEEEGSNLWAQLVMWALVSYFCLLLRLFLKPAFTVYKYVCLKKTQPCVCACFVAIVVMSMHWLILYILFDHQPVSSLILTRDIQCNFKIL